MSGLGRRAAGALGLRAEEGGTVGLAMAVSFLSSAGIIIAQSAIDALFFARYGVDKLPVMYLLVGVAMFGTTLGVGAVLSRLGRGRAFLLVLATVSVAALVGRAAIETGQGWVYAALWLAYSVGEFLQLLAVWGLAGLVADTRQAKRFFPIIAAGGVAGLILGGLATAPIATAVGSENLLLVWATLTAGAAVLGRRLVTTRSARALHAPSRGPRRASALAEGLRDVRGSQLLRWMSLGALLTALMFYLLYLPFSEAAVERYPDPDELAGFFGLFFAVAMGTGLVLSLLVTGRLLARFGVPTVVVVLPVLYLVAFSVLAAAAAFATLTLFRFAQVAWLSGGASSTWEALVNTIPAERRDRVRAFIYGIPKQVGTITAGFVALAAQATEEPRILYGVGIAAAAGAVFAISRVRVAYSRALVAALREGRPPIFAAPSGPRPATLHADATSLTILGDLLRDPDPAMRHLAVHTLGESNLPASAPALSAAAVADDDPGVRAAALDALARVDPSSAVGAARDLVSDPEPAVRLAALGALARGGATPDERLLDDPDAAVRASSAALLLDATPRARDALESLARAPDPALRVAAMRAIAASGDRRGAGLALAALDDPVPGVRADAVRAHVATAPDRAERALVSALGDPHASVREAAAESLARLGPSVADAVAEGLFDERRDGALATLERLPLDGTASRVREFAADSVARALNDFELAQRLGDDGPGVVALLRDSLRARAHRRAVDALRAAALLGDRAAVATALDSLDVSDPAQRANALEVVETVGEPTIVRPLLALWEPRASGRSDGTPIAPLLDDPDPWIRDCARLAAAAREGGTMTRTLTTLPLVERVLILRKVPLFAALPPQDLQPIADVAEEHVFSNGDTIATAGEPGDTTYVIVEGEVEVVSAAGEPLAVRRQGDVIGEMAVISSRPRVASLLARSHVRVLEIRKPAFEAILRERPETALAMMRVLCDRLAAAGETTRAAG